MVSQNWRDANCIFCLPNGLQRGTDLDAANGVKNKAERELRQARADTTEVETQLADGKDSKMATTTGDSFSPLVRLRSPAEMLEGEWTFLAGEKMNQ